jgi:hypothetical protein
MIPWHSAQPSRGGRAPELVRLAGESPYANGVDFNQGDWLTIRITGCWSWQNMP